MENIKRKGWATRREIMETLQKVYTKANDEPQKRIDEILAEIKSKAPAFNVSEIDATYIRVNDAAGKIGDQQAHAAIYKIASKFAHPTALILVVQDPPAKMLDSLFELGAIAADGAVKALEVALREVFPVV